MRPGVYEQRAHAKVNLGLAVLTRRGDGFHEVETVLAQVDLADSLTVRVEPAAPGSEPVILSVSLDPAAAELPGAGELATGEDNLAYRAASAYLEARAERLAASGHLAEGHVGVRVELWKRVPVAAGMGGGSSDAAAVLRALREADESGGALAQPVVPSEELARLALQLGSDVPFFLANDGAALARGRGERLTPVKLPKLHLVLANPGTAVSAASAYQQLVGFTPRLRFERALGRLSEGLDPSWANGLQPGVLRAHPHLREVLNALRGAGLNGVVMSGSGATCFGVAPTEEEASAAARELAAAHPGWWVMATSTLGETALSRSAGGTP